MKYQPVTALLLLMLSASVWANDIQKIVNYQENQNVAPWLKKLKNLNRGENVKFRIIQIGDSHTAGGFMTDELRQVLQTKWGDGGIGWVYPQAINGQRTSTVSYEGNQWRILSSARQEHRQLTEYPLGGIVARTKGANALTIQSKNPTSEPQNIVVSMHPMHAKGPLHLIGADKDVTYAYGLHGDFWQYFLLNAKMPLTFQPEGEDEWQLGAISIENTKPKGVVVSALGLNGAQLSQWRDWRRNLHQDLAETQADLVVLEYGTNEAFNDRIDLAQSELYWLELIREIKQALPNAGVLMMGAPESLKQKTGKCGVRPARLTDVQELQRAVAEQEQILYWDWEQAMGGKCTMNVWVNNKLAASDGVHFAPKGYQRIGKRFADAIIDMAQ